MSTDPYDDAALIDRAVAAAVLPLIERITDDRMADYWRVLIVGVLAQRAHVTLESISNPRIRDKARALARGTMDGKDQNP